MLTSRFINVCRRGTVDVVYHPRGHPSFLSNLNYSRFLPIITTNLPTGTPRLTSGFSSPSTTSSTSTTFTRPTSHTCTSSSTRNIPPTIMSYPERFRQLSLATRLKSSDEEFSEKQEYLLMFHLKTQSFYNNIKYSLFQECRSQLLASHSVTETGPTIEDMIREKPRTFIRYCEDKTHDVLYDYKIKFAANYPLRHLHLASYFRQFMIQDAAFWKDFKVLIYPRYVEVIWEDLNCIVESRICSVESDSRIKFNQVYIDGSNPQVYQPVNPTVASLRYTPDKCDTTPGFGYISRETRGIA